MRKIQSAELNMFNATIACCDDNAAVTSTVTDFGPALDELKAIVTQINAIDQAAIQNTKGITTDKNVSKEKVCAEAYAIASAVFAYASKTGNNTLKGQVSYTQANLLKTSYVKLPQKLNIIYAAANTNIAHLAGSLITSARLTAYQALITDYSSRLPSVRNATSGRAINILRLNDLFKQAKAILKDQLDLLALQLQSSSPYFYMEYMNNRRVLGPPTFYTRIAGIITDQTTGNPIGGVLVAATDVADINLNYMGSSKADGYYAVYVSRFQDTFTVNYTHPGYTNVQITNVKLTLGRTTRQNVTMTPAS